MEVKLAKTAGFCFGVQRAVDTVYKALEKGVKIYTYGPIIHNENVIAELKALGVGIIHGRKELETLLCSGELLGSFVIIRAHGIGIEEEKLLKAYEPGIKLIDATCPLVKKVQDAASTHYLAGEEIIIAGTASHPEIQGILSRIDYHAHVVASREDAEDLKLPPDKISCLLAQTTFNTRKFKDIVEILKNKIYHVNVVDTVCLATELRQKEAYELSLSCDAMIVIGSRDSSNTAKLYEISAAHCSSTQYVGSLAELDSTGLARARCVGITAGASTPYSIIEEVLQYVRQF